jgi:fatty-acyl-CoA synthase
MWAASISTPRASARYAPAASSAWDSTQVLSASRMPKGLSVAHGIPLSEESGIGALTLGAFLREVAGRYAANEAAVMHMGGGVECWTYADLLARSIEVARALVACGVTKGTRVGIIATNRLEFLSTFFGTALTGGIAAPISTFSTTHELEQVLQLACCSVLLTERQVLKKDFVAMLEEIEPTFAGSMPVASTKLPFLRHVALIGSDERKGAIEAWSTFLARGDGISQALVEARADAVTPSDPAALFFSSGSTGKPKGILSTQRGICLQLWRWPRWLDLREAPRAWSANGFFWSGNFAMALGSTLSAGGSLILQRWFDADEALTLMEKERASVLFAWPHQRAQLAAADGFLGADLSSLKYVDASSQVAQHPSRYRLA